MELAELSNMNKNLVINILALLALKKIDFCKLIVIYFMDLYGNHPNENADKQLILRSYLRARL